MRKKPVYIFNGLGNTGIDKVPYKSQILIIDDGNGFPIFVQKVSNGHLDSNSTIDDFLRNVIDKFGTEIGIVMPTKLFLL